MSVPRHLPATDRRAFMRATGSAFAALLTSGCMTRVAMPGMAAFEGYGPLLPDPAGLLDLPRGFAYTVVSRLGDRMDDGLTVPDAADGMGAFALPGGRIGLVRNHELTPDKDAGGLLTTGYGRMADGKVLPGGTTTLVLHPETLAVERQHRSLAGTIRNCAGGTTPWGSWLSCEEPSSALADLPDHGFVFEVPAAATGVVDSVPLKALGRMSHEAAAVDPATGIVYLTEDRDDSLFYRFIPREKGRLAAGGQLQAMKVDGLADSRNWAGTVMPVAQDFPVRWVDLDSPEAPLDDLRQRGAAAGATIIARGEGLHMGEREVYFCSTSGGVARLGQIFRLRPARGGGMDTVQLFFESISKDQFNYGDNLTVATNGHLIVCEDQYTDVVDNHLRGIAPDGRPYDFARLRMQTELAGACFSPDGRTLFVNAYSPSTTIAIRGPWVA